LSYNLFYHPDVRKDLSKIDERLKRRIGTALEKRTLTAPEKYGEPLRRSLKGFWKMRVGDYRVVYKVSGRDLLILAIVHRKKAYEVAEKRI